MTFQKELLHNYHEFSTPEKVKLGDGRALGSGNIRSSMHFKVSNPKPAVMYDVLYVACNLFSVRAAAQKRNFVKFGRSKCWIRGKAGSLLGMGSVRGKLYRLDCECEKASPIPEQACEESLDLWHQRLGHVNEKYLNTMSRCEMVTGTQRNNFCEGCVEGKMHRQPFKSVEKHP